MYGTDKMISIVADLESAAQGNSCHKDGVNVLWTDEHVKFKLYPQGIDVKNSNFFRDLGKKL